MLLQCGAALCLVNLAEVGRPQQRFSRLWRLAPASPSPVLFFCDGETQNPFCCCARHSEPSALHSALMASESQQQLDLDGACTLAGLKHIQFIPGFLIYLFSTIT